MKPIIAIDIDGVTLDYKAAYARKWQRAFGRMPRIKNPKAAKLWEYYDIPHLAKDSPELAKLEAAADDDFWSTMPPMGQAVSAVRLIRSYGYRTISVSAAPNCQAENRAFNLARHGFEMDDVICNQIDGAISPKTQIINDMQPAYFVDDYINYFHGVNRSVKKVLINEPENHPSEHVSLAEMDLVLPSLFSFALWLRDYDNRS